MCDHTIEIINGTTCSFECPRQIHFDGQMHNTNHSKRKKFLWGFSKKCSTYSLIQKRKTFMLWQLVKRNAGNKFLKICTYLEI